MLEAVMKRVASLVFRNAAILCILVLPGVWAYAADSQGTWSVAAQMTTARTEIVADASNGKIYVAGGQTPSTQASPLFQESDPKTSLWRDLAPMPKGASHPGIASLNGKIYVAGGFTVTVHKNPIDQLLEYDIATDTWGS